MLPDAGPHTPLVDQYAASAQRRAIVLASAMLVVGAVAALPHAGQRVVVAPAVAGVFGSLSCVADLLTFFLLATRLGHAGSPAIRAIACAYLFSGLMAMLHVATFPGAVITDEPLIGSRETVGWLFLGWRFGFSLLLLIGVAWGAVRHSAIAADERASGRALRLAVAGTFVAVLLCFVAALWLPTLGLPVKAINTVNGAFGTWPLLASWSAAAFCAVALAVILLTRRLHRTLYLWIGFVLLANGLGLAMSETGGARYTVGWYGARAYALLASGVVLGLLMAEVLRLQRSLAWSAARLGEHAQSLQTEIHRRTAAEQRLLQSQQQELMGRIAGGLAHDFNNHLQVIAMRLELMRRRRMAGDVPGQSIDDDVAVMTRTLRRAEGLTRQLLSVAGRRTLQPRRLRLQEWMPPFAELLRTMAPDLPIEISSGPELGVVMADAGELESALVNLVGNARDALLEHVEGRIAIELRNVDADDGRSWVEIAVRDNGSGMAADVLDRVFEPFFSTKALGKGSGLGLSQVQSFAIQSHGEVAIDSAPGRGTTVRLRLPRVADPASSDGARPAETGPAEDPAAEPRLLHGATILIVDDDDEVAGSTDAVLRQLGFVVHRARGAQQALEQLERLRPRLVLSDVVMPGPMSGLDLARKLRRTDPALPVILSTAFSGSADDAQAEGFTLLMKPYQAAELEALIWSVLQTPSA